MLRKRAFTQANLFVRRVLEQMGITSLDKAIARLRGSGVPAEARVADFLDNRRQAVRELARDLIERRLALAADERSRARDEFLRDASLTNVDRRDLERMRLLVRTMARKLATRYGRTRKRARRGVLDIRHTMRRNVAFDGVPFRTTWKQKKITKPRVVVLCDVSGSVAALAQFLLLFVHSLNEALGDIRSFAFSSTTIEVTEMLEKAPTIDDAISQIMYAIGFRSSDYGRSFEEFERRWPDIVDRKTTVIILGDGRTNYGNLLIENRAAPLRALETAGLAQPREPGRLGPRRFRDAAVSPVHPQRNRLQPPAPPRSSGQRTIGATALS